MTAGLHRFFVDPATLGSDRVALGGAQAHQISRVLRLKSGDRLVLADGSGQEYVVRLDDVRSSAVTGTVERAQPSRPEPSLILTLYQALVPRDRFETVLQKGTEVGVARFVPTWCERSIVPGGERIDADTPISIVAKLATMMLLESPLMNLGVMIDGSDCGELGAFAA